MNTTLVAQWLIETAWQSAALVVLVWVTQMVLRRWLSPAWRCGLWAVVAIRLVMPVLPASGVSVYGLLGRHGSTVEQSTPAVVAAPVPRMEVHVAPPEDVRPVEVPAIQAPVHATVAAGPTWQSLLVVVWLCVAGSLLARQVVQAMALRRLRRCATPCDIACTVSVLESDRIRTPALAGLFRPYILLPRGTVERLSPEQLGLVLEHELMHLRRGDHWGHAAASVLQAMHWFNPFVYFAISRYRLERELACDRAVLNAQHIPGRRATYGKTLLDLATWTPPGRQFATVAMAEGTRHLKARIAEIAADRPGRGSAVAGIVTALLLVICGLTQAQTVQTPNTAALPGHPVAVPTSRSAIQADATQGTHPFTFQDLRFLGDVLKVDDKSIMISLKYQQGIRRPAATTKTFVLDKQQTRAAIATPMRSFPNDWGIPITTFRTTPLELSALKVGQNLAMAAEGDLATHILVLPPGENLAMASGNPSEPGEPGPATRPTSIATGNITKLDGNNLTVDSRRPAPTGLVTVLADDNAQVVLDGQRAYLDDLKERMSVDVTSFPATARFPVRLQIIAWSPRLSGTVVRLDGRNVIVRATKPDGTSSEVTVPTNDQTKITVPGTVVGGRLTPSRSIHLEELGEGMRVSILPETGTAERIDVLPARRSTTRPVATQPSTAEEGKQSRPRMLGPSATVLKVEEGSITVRLFPTDTEGAKEVTVAIQKRTMVSILEVTEEKKTEDGRLRLRYVFKAGKLGDVKVGQRVNVIADDEGAREIQVWPEPPKTEKEAEGKTPAALGTAPQSGAPAANGTPRRRIAMGTLVKVDGKNLVIDAQRGEITVPTDETTVFRVNFDPGKLEDLKAEMTVTVTTRGPTPTAPAGLSVDAVSPTLDGMVVSVDGKNMAIRQAGAEPGDSRESIVTTDENTKYLFVAVGRTPGKVGSLEDVKAGMFVKVIPETGTAEKILIGPSVRAPASRPGSDAPLREGAGAGAGAGTGSGSASGPMAAATTTASTEQERAIAEIKRVGGVVKRDEKASGSPAISVALNFARITDAALVHLDALPELQMLDLSSQSFPGVGVPAPVITDAGMVHLARLTKLRTLGLVGARITDGGLVYLEGLTQLESLWLNRTGVTDIGLAHLETLTHLKELHLDDTKVSGGGLAHLRGMGQLQLLALSRTATDDAGLQHLQGLTQLQGLYLDGTRVTDAGLAHLEGLTQLQALLLSRTKVTDAGLVHLARLTKLYSLGLDETGLTDAGMEQLKGLTELQILSMAQTSVADAGLADVETMPLLRALYLRLTRVTDAGLVHLERLAELSRIDLSQTQVSDAGLEHLAGLAKLGNLDLSQTRVTDDGLMSVQRLVNLTDLKLGQTGVTDAGLMRLSALKRLRSLDLKGSAVTAEGVKRFQESLPECRIRN